MVPEFERSAIRALEVSSFRTPRFDFRAAKEARCPSKASRRRPPRIDLVFKEHEAGVSVAAANMASATPVSTNGKRSSAGWSLGGQAAEDAGGREHAAEAVAGGRAMLDNAALKDLLGKKW
jgi:hypothetical protein